MSTTEVKLLPIVREFQPTDSDYQAITDIDNAVMPDYPLSVAERRYEDEQLDRDKYDPGRYMAEDPLAGQVIGYVEYRHQVSHYSPARYVAWAAVRPAFQGRGLGSRLMDLAEAELARKGAERIIVESTEKLPGSIEFLTRRGYREVSRSWESRINPQEFNPTPFRKYSEQVADLGIEIATLAALKESDPDWLSKLYNMSTAIEPDIPSPYEHTEVTKEQFRRMELEGPGRLMDGYFIAIKNGIYVGESYVIAAESEPQALYQGLTGVRREYRGRGIAIALKLQVMEYARSKGYTRVKTWNSTLNEGMLAINARLGFVRQPFWGQYEKQVG